MLKNNSRKYTYQYNIRLKMSSGVVHQANYLVDYSTNTTAEVE